MEYILFAVALFGALVTAGAAVVGVLAYAYFNPQEKWIRRAIYWALALIVWGIMNSI
jgi:intracellular septation protein A